MWICLGSSGLQLRQVPWLCLKSPITSLHLGLSICQLLLYPSLPQLHLPPQGSLVPLAPLCQRSPCLSHGHIGLQLRFVTTPLQFLQPLPSIQLRLGPQSHRLCLSPLTAWLQLGHLSLQLHLGLQGHHCCPVSLANHLHQMSVLPLKSSDKSTLWLLPL